MDLRTSFRPYLAWLCVAVFFFYQYVLRIFPAVTVDQLRSEFKITAEQFSTFGSLYLLAYSLLQIPLGLIVDRIGVKITVLISIITCVLGALLFSLAQTLLIVQISRFIIGMGSASAFMCCLKIITDQISPNRRGFLMGATLTIGVSGPILYSIGIADMISNTLWRDMLFYTAMCGVILLVITLLVIKKDSVQTYSSNNLAKSIVSIFKNKHIMIYAILAVGLYTPLSVLADLWGVAFLQQKYGLNSSEAPYISMIVYVGLVLGSIVLPLICEKYNLLNQGILICGVFILLLFGIIVYGPQFSKPNLIIILLSLGFFCGAEMMCFTGALQYTNNNSGEIIGVVNTLNMLGGAILHHLVGMSLDYQWSGEYISEGVRFYNTTQFINSLSILTIVIFVCCVISLRLKKN